MCFQDHLTRVCFIILINTFFTADLTLKINPLPSTPKAMLKSVIKKTDTTDPAFMDTIFTKVKGDLHHALCYRHENFNPCPSTTIQPRNDQWQYLSTSNQMAEVRSKCSSFKSLIDDLEDTSTRNVLNSNGVSFQCGRSNILRSKCSISYCMYTYSLINETN